MKVNKFKVGDRISVFGNHGVVAEVMHDVRFIKQVPCTYLKVYFDEDTGLRGTAYDGGWYGGLDDEVEYGYLGGDDI